MAGMVWKGLEGVRERERLEGFFGLWVSLRGLATDLVRSGKVVGCRNAAGVCVVRRVCAYAPRE
jgi:hypothetical protein